MIKNNSAFTLMEILVVIAIIGVLSTVVMASLSSARGRSINASIKSSLANARAQGELFQATNTLGYLGICLPANSSGGEESIRRFFDVAHQASGATSLTDVQSTAQSGTTMSACHASGSGWAISVPLKVPEVSGATTYYYFCVDSIGSAVSRVSPLGSGAIVCPAT